MNPKNKGLGRGLGAIFEIEGKDLPAKKSNHAFEEVEIASVVPNPKQPARISTNRPSASWPSRSVRWA